MRHYINILLLLLLPVFGLAQDTVVTVTPAMFNKPTDQFFLSASDQWFFKQGNDTAWAGKNINISGWKKMKPAGLSVKYADKNGRVECWFRIKVKLDPIFGNQLFGIKYSDWGAADLYVDGKLVSSFGNTGKNGAAFREYSPFFNPALPVNLKHGTEYTIAVHFVDYVAPFPLGRLKSENLALASFMRITGPRYNTIFLQQCRQGSVYDTVWVAVSVILTFLFWFLSIQNPFEKNLRLIAIGNTFLMLGMYFAQAFQGEVGITYNRSVLYLELANFFIGLSAIMSLLVVAAIFKRKITTAVKIFLAIGVAGLVPGDLLPHWASGIYALCFFGTSFAICLYYIISSWKSLKGAQWAVVIGLLLGLTFGVLYIVFINVMRTNSANLGYLLMSGFALSFPLLQMVYVAMRFREILKEVQQNATEVVHLSEEKKEEALNRQKVLEVEVNRQTAEIRTTLDNLKATQTQLIQSEKMASLGELTAGIAHEIQNPLNFVNNFSEVSKELMDELNEELDKGDTEKARVISQDVIQNLEKIVHHGKRADAIVKGMLQHSQSGSGTKEPTNINVLADEYLRLSYHGLRSKDKSFNADLLTNFDEKLPKVNVIPQDIGRVLLNLFNNAFYTVNQKQKTAVADYKPEVSVTTSSENGQVVIKVKDNGIGIPDAIKEKIMQPFFTTKPTGEGTGLGLSLSYDIVVKGHGGSININSKEGEYTEFVICIPV
jgi:two-component system NtrC family sensor kinase